MKLWAGRFSKDLEAKVLAFSESTEVDERLAPFDIWGSKAHALMLAKCGILDTDSLRKILRELGRAQADLETGKLKLKPELEDVHMNIETYVIEGAGPEFGGKLHSARSRNDQVMVDHKLYLREQILAIMGQLVSLSRTLLELAGAHLETPMPGFTHTQVAQPMSLAFWATSYVAHLMRDLERFQSCFAKTNTNPLGACAFSGTSHPTDRRITTLLLGFDDVQLHAMDCVANRDFALEFLAACAILAEATSKLSEEFVWWSTPAIGMVEVDDAYATGSSIMPQKKNPCVAELARGKTARLHGALMQELSLTKGLPNAYNRDLQEDKVPVWEAIDTVTITLAVLEGMLKTTTFRTERMKELAGAGFSTATELADYLVRRHKLAFRTAHHLSGATVAGLIDQGKDFSDLEATLALLTEQGVRADAGELAEALSPEGAMRAHTSIGGTASEAVTSMITTFIRQLDGYDGFVRDKVSQLATAREATERAVQQMLQGGTTEHIPQPSLVDEYSSIDGMGDDYIR